MTSWRAAWRRSLVAVCVVTGSLLAVIALRVHAATSPPHHTAEPLDFTAVGLPVRDVRFEAADGTSLAGWLFEGRPGWPPVVLCHDWGSGKQALVNLAIEIGRHGFPVLLFDLRGHGESAPGRSTFGVAEKRDVLGAIDFLEAPRVGIYGAGMGAHAAVLAARDRRAVRVLVLDGLYPTAVYPLIRKVYSGWELGIRDLGFVPVALASLMSGVALDDERADRALASLADRDLLLLAPARDAALAAEIQRMYEGLPPQPDADGSLVVLPATVGDGLYGEDRARHHAHVVRFFVERLARGE